MLGFELNRGRRGCIKEGLELTPMGSFNIGQGGVNSGPGSYRVPDGVRTDRLASACVLCPLNCLVLYFKTGGVTG